MFLCVAGSLEAHVARFISLMESKGYTALEYREDVLSEIMSSRRWSMDFVLRLPSPSRWAEFKKRPFCVLVNVVSPLSRADLDTPESLGRYNSHLEAMHTLKREEGAFLNEYNYKEVMYSSVREEVDRVLRHKTRPDWDEYFIRIAVSISSRSNCMKRKVGAIIVNRNRIVTTGYNGTASRAKNCMEWGCKRCNENKGCGQSLGDCFCLHAEESAFLEARGNDCEGGTLYVTVFPCRLCSRKIVQLRIERIVYLEEYNLDAKVVKLFREKGVEFMRYAGSLGLFVTGSLSPSTDSLSTE